MNNYEDLLKAINSSISVNDVSDLIENNIYNINLSSSKITFDIDINQLSDDLYKNNYKFNLLLLECSLNENFFKFNQNLEECPNFKLISFNQKKYIYLNYLDSYFRIKEFSLNEKLNDIWINFFEKKINSYEILIEPSNYTKLSKHLGKKPKIISYKNNKVKVKTYNYFNNKQIHFLLNFF